MRKSMGRGKSVRRWESERERGERQITNYDFRGTIEEEASFPAVGLAKAGGYRPEARGESGDR